MGDQFVGWTMLRVGALRAVCLLTLLLAGCTRDTMRATPPAAPVVPAPTATAPRSGGRPTGPSATPPTDDVAAAQEVVALINAQRAAHGCATPLVPVAELAQAAARHSQDMATHDFLDHAGSDGSDPGQRISAAGYRWDAGAPGEPLWAENVAAGYDDPAAMVAG